jgi:hypothetical protein
MQPLLQLSLKPQKRNTNTSSASMLLQIASAMPRFLSRLSHLASKSLQHLVWVISPLQKVVLHNYDRGDTPLAWQKTCEKVVCAIKPEIQTCKISRILTSNYENSYDVATDALSSQTIIQGINWYIIQYDFLSIIMIPHGISSAFTPTSINSLTKWLHAIDVFDRLEDHRYSAWQEFILRHGTDVEIKSNDWLKGTLLQFMEVTLCAEGESDLQGLPVNHRGAVTMLCFIIKRLINCNQEAWDALEDYVKTFDICNFPGKNVPTAFLKLKAVINVLGDKTPSNAIRTILEGFAHASTDTFTDVCKSKIAMRSDSIYTSLLDKVPLCSQVSLTLDNLEQKYQQLITANKWEGVGHVGMDNHNKSAFKATANPDNEEQSYATYVNNKATLLKFDKWAKYQTCHHCGNKGHIRPNCREYLAEKANGTLPPPGKKRLTRPAPAFIKYHCEKLQKDPKLKAFLSAFSAFTTKYLADSQPVASETMTNGDDHNDLASCAEDEDNINAFLCMVGALKE